MVSASANRPTPEPSGPRCSCQNQQLRETPAGSNYRVRTSPSRFPPLRHQQTYGDPTTPRRAARFCVDSYQRDLSASLLGQLSDSGSADGTGFAAGAPLETLRRSGSGGLSPPCYAVTEMPGGGGDWENVQLSTSNVERRTRMRPRGLRVSLHEFCSRREFAEDR